MPSSTEAGLWGLLGGSALVLGAAAAYLAALPQRAIAAAMAIGSGVLISAVAFDLMDEAYARGGFDSTALIPEALETTHKYSSLITVVGFLAAIVLSKLGG